MKHLLHLYVDRRELATILAALRYHQAENLSHRSPRATPVIADSAIADIASDGGTLRPLTAAEIDRLCRRLNQAAARKGG